MEGCLATYLACWKQVSEIEQFLTSAIEYLEKKKADNLIQIFSKVFMEFPNLLPVLWWVILLFELVSSFCLFLLYFSSLHGTELPNYIIYKCYSESWLWYFCNSTMLAFYSPMQYIMLSKLRWYVFWMCSC